MSIPLGWTITSKGNYLCMCKQFKTKDISEINSHMSEFDGFCARGLKCTSIDKFECICGEEFIENKEGKCAEYLACNHIYDQMEGILKICIKRFRNKCQKCNIQLDSPAALRLHYTSKYHINFGNKVNLYCKICHVKSDCQKEILTHLATKKHMKKTLLI